jgi:uncharacterized repeat protein (TIGR02543 family)
VEISISSGEDTLYVLGADTLSNNYDTLIYGDSDETDPNLQKGYWAALKNFGCTSFSYELLQPTDSGLYDPDGEFIINGNAIEFINSADESVYSESSPYRAVVAAYATLEYNGYKWKFLFATKKVQIVNQVSVTYDSNYTGGPASYTDTAPVGNYTILGNSNANLNFAREGYTFLGWSKNASATAADPVYAAGAVYSGAANLTLYAIWGKTDNQVSFTVTYDSNYTGGPAAYTETSTAGNYTILDNSDAKLGFTREGYTFLGWSKNASATAADLAYAAGAVYIGATDLTLYAIWEKNAPTPTKKPIKLPSSSQNTTVYLTTTPTPTLAPIYIGETTTDNEISSVALRLSDQLYAVKLWYGMGTGADGRPIYSLDTALTRMQALTMVIRLLGLEKTALEYTGVHPFGDVPEWGDRIVAYAYSRGITVGISATKFDSDSLVTQQQFNAFLLRVLGYYEKYGDFEYKDAVSKAVSVNLFTQNEANLFAIKPYYLRAYAVINICDGLQTRLKGSNVLLVDNLVALGALTRSDADALLSAIAKIYYR